MSHCLVIFVVDTHISTLTPRFWYWGHVAERGSVVPCRHIKYETETHMTVLEIFERVGHSGSLSLVRMFLRSWNAGASFCKSYDVPLCSRFLCLPLPLPPWPASRPRVQRHAPEAKLSCLPLLCVGPSVMLGRLVFSTAL